MTAAKVKKQPRGVCLVGLSVIVSKEPLLTADHQSMGEHTQSESGELTDRTTLGISTSRPWSELSRQAAQSFSRFALRQ
jgi:hypothetical protein